MDKEEIHRVFSSNLKRMMDENGVNGKELAARVGVSGAQVTAWTQGVHMPRSNHLAILTEIFDCRPSDLLTDKAKDPSPKDDRSLPDGYYQLSEEKRALVDNLIRQLAETK